MPGNDVVEASRPRSSGVMQVVLHPHVSVVLACSEFGLVAVGLLLG